MGPHISSQQYGQSGAWISELLPQYQRIVDKIAIIKSMYTDEFNHAPAEMLLYTGNRRPGYASMGSWITYGLGSESQNLPGFVVLVSGGTDPPAARASGAADICPACSRACSAAARASRSCTCPIPRAWTATCAGRALMRSRTSTRWNSPSSAIPRPLTRISQYELAYRMQMEVPEVMDISREPKDILRDVRRQPGAGSFANNCLLARRLIESGVRYVQLFDWGWDCHGTGPIDDLITHLPEKCKEMDRPVAALLNDLEQRGLLDDTLVVWGGEFGRTPLNEERNGSKFLGRDHHPHAFTIWMAGGGIKPGIVYGQTDDLGYHITKDKMHVHDLQATILAAMGMDGPKFSYPYQGLNQRLIGPRMGLMLTKSSSHEIQRVVDGRGPMAGSCRQFGRAPSAASA